MKKVFLVYGHYNEKSFNSAIKDAFIKSAEEKGHSVDCIDLYKEKFNPVYAGEKADEVVPAGVKAGADELPMGKKLLFSLFSEPAI